MTKKYIFKSVFNTILKLFSVQLQSSFFITIFYYILKIKTNKIADTVVCLVFTDIDSFLLKLKYSYQDNQHSPISLVPLWKRSRPFLQSGKYSKI